MRYEPTNSEIHETAIYKRALEAANLIETPDFSPEVSEWLKIVDDYREVCRELNSTYARRFETSKFTNGDFQDNALTFQTIQANLNKAIALHNLLTDKIALAVQYENEWQTRWDINMNRQEILANAYQVAKAWLIEQHKAEMKKGKAK